MMKAGKESKLEHIKTSLTLAGGSEDDSAGAFAGG
jgi:hypothetical protein